MRRLRLDPGTFAAEVELQRAEPVPDGMGGFAEGWKTVATLFARVESVSARSVFGADQRLETVTHRVTMRRHEAVLSGMRLLLKGRILSLVTVRDPDETGRYVVCEAREEGR